MVSHNKTSLIQRRMAQLYTMGTGAVQVTGSSISQSIYNEIIEDMRSQMEGDIIHEIKKGVSIRSPVSQIKNAELYNDTWAIGSVKLQERSDSEYSVKWHNTFPSTDYFGSSDTTEGHSIRLIRDGREL